MSAWSRIPKTPSPAIKHDWSESLALKVAAIYGLTPADIYGYFEYGTIIRYTGGDHPVIVSRLKAMSLGKCGKALMFPLYPGQQMMVFEPKPTEWVADMPK